MTITTRGSLLYGYVLGGGEQPWRFATTPPAVPALPAWFNPAAPDHDFAYQAHLHLLTSIGVPTDDIPDGYELRELADEHTGVHIERYSWDAAPSFALAAHTTTAYYDTPEPLDLLALDHRRTHENWEIGLVPHAPGPQWLLISSQ